MEQKEQFTGWITKYALSSGIIQATLEKSSNYESMVSLVKNEKFRPSQNFHGEGVDWHRTLDSAVNKANDMRIKKIASLKKQITKLEKLRFE